MSINIMHREISLEESLSYITNQELKDFIKKYEPYHVERVGEYEIIFDEVNYLGREYMIIVNISTSTSKVIFRDSVITPNDLQNIYGISEIITKSTFNNFIKEIEILGCKLVNPYIGDDNFTYYDIVIPEDIFSSDLIRKCIELWDAHNKRMESYIMLEI